MIQKGFALPLIIIGILLLIGVIGGGAYYLGTQRSNIVTPPPQQKACTQEAKQCPDGSYVGRVGPNCEFSACSVSSPSASLIDETANWKTYTIPNIGTIKYPPTYIIKASIPNVITIADKEESFGPSQTSILIDYSMTGDSSNYNKAISNIKDNIEHLSNGVKTSHIGDIYLNNKNQTFRYTNIYYKYREGAIVIIYGDDLEGSRRYDEILKTFKFTQ